jgi:hypothetical protein
MKHFRTLIIILLAIEGVAVISTALLAPVQIPGSATISMPADGTGHEAVDMKGGGVLVGDFSTSSGRQVLFMILDEDQYSAYLIDATHDSWFSEISSSGSFNIDRASVERYHIVVQQALDPPSAEQISLTYTVETMKWDIAFIGIGILAVSSIGSGVMMIKQQKDKKARREPLSPYVDVVFFDEVSKR